MMVGSSGVLSIGALSAATGIPVETIRTWERRYGFPVAERKPSGHRVYPVSTVPRLRLISQALARGHRAAEVVPASEAALEALLAAVPAVPAAVSPGSTPVASSDPTELLAAVSSFHAETLKRAFQAEWAQRGPLDFVEQVAAPFLTAIGNAWESGEVDVRHEHFASAVLGDFLRSVRMPLDDRAHGPVAVLATLSGERHGLGLQLAALVFALAGWRALVLGVETPPEQIVALTKEAPIAAVALSYVLPDSDDADLRTLRRRIAREIPLLVGGEGAQAKWAGRGIYVLRDLRQLDDWLRSSSVRA
jgi:DNA-binding transcriptional MerR regulator